MNLGLHLRLYLFDPKTPDKRELVYDQPAHSFLSVFLKLLLTEMLNASNFETWKDYQGTDRRTYTGDYQFYIPAAVGLTYRGISIGTDDTPVTMIDYDLGARILHGITAGRMQYTQGGYTMVDTDGETTFFLITRSFSNSSGSTITVKETGIFVLAHYSSSLWKEALIIRDIITPTAVPDGRTLAIDYSLEIVL